MSPKKVLVVDDDEEIIMLVRIMLQRDGYATITAASGPEALQKFEQEAPDLVLLDIAMPGMNGFEVVRQIREREREDAYTPIVFLTAHSQGYYTPDEFDGQFDGYLTKPLTSVKLTQVLARLLKR